MNQQVTLKQQLLFSGSIKRRNVVINIPMILKMRFFCGVLRPFLPQLLFLLNYFELCGNINEAEGF